MERSGFNVDAWLKKNGYAVIDPVHRQRIDTWREWYEGFVDSFHKYSIYNGINTITQQRKSMQMAKVICEEWANLLLNERVSINVVDGLQEPLHKVLDANDFYQRANRLIETTFALGAGAFVEYIGANGLPCIDYVRGSMIYPLSWQGQKITECAFGSVQMVDAKEVYYLQLHKISERGTYTIENHLFDNGNGDEVQLPADIMPVVDTGSVVPLFQVFAPNIVNNADLDCPMGISVFANAIDMLKHVDSVFDSYDNEIQLGRKRVFIPLSMARIEMTNERGIDGKPVMRPAFDPRDAVFYALQSDEEKPVELDMQLRTTEHETALKNALAMLGKAVGLGSDRFVLDNAGGVKTATEVVSDKSDLYQNLRKHEIALESAVFDMVNALCYLLGYAGDPETVITFDDSVIEDRKSELEDAITKINAGLVSKRTVMQTVLGMTEEQAEKELRMIADEQRVTVDSVDAYLTGEDRPAGVDVE